MTARYSKPTIAIDIDDVLADNAKGFVEFSNQRWGTTLAVEDYDEHWAKLWQVDNEETERRANEFHESGVLSTYGHNHGAGLALEKLKIKFNLIVITSRRIQTKSETTLWIHERYPGIFDDDHIHFAGIWDAISDHSISRTKGELSRELGADYLIDDQLKHCIGAATLGVRALLFGNYSWNQTDDLPHNVQRVEDWSGVLRYFDGRD